jgi:hypothetical protein
MNPDVSVRARGVMEHIGPTRATNAGLFSRRPAFEQADDDYSRSRQSCDHASRDE